MEECESATRIRVKHLVALEEDRPGDLPDMAHARLFLRGYAAFLGLVLAPPAGTIHAAAPVAVHRAKGRSAPAAVLLALTGAGVGGSYVGVQRGDAGGPVVYEGTIRPAQTVRLTVSGALWMRVGWAPDLRVALSAGRSPCRGGRGTSSSAGPARPPPPDGTTPRCPAKRLRPFPRTRPGAHR